MPYANNKDKDQPAHPCSLINVFIIPCLDSVIPIGALSEIPGFLLASVAEQAGLSPTWLHDIFN